MARIDDKREQYEGEREFVAPHHVPTHKDDGTQLNPKNDGFVPQTKAERRAWKKTRKGSE
jgi:hypothetical protein